MKRFKGIGLLFLWLLPLVSYAKQVTSSTPYTMDFGGLGTGAFEPDSSMLNLFGGVFKFGSTILLVVQILVTIVLIITAAWQTAQFLSGQQGLDGGKYAIYMLGLVVLFILTWETPTILTKQYKSSSTTTTVEGATLNVDKIVQVDTEHHDNHNKLFKVE